MPQRARRSSSSSGIASRVRISRWWRRDSWSSQTCVLLAMSTSRGIHAESLENRSGSASRPDRSGASPRPPAPPSPPPPNRRWSPRSSSAMTSSVTSSRSSRASRSAPSRPAPVVAHVAQLPGERGRVRAGRARAGARPASRRWGRSASARPGRPRARRSSASRARAAAACRRRGRAAAGPPGSRWRSGPAAAPRAGPGAGRSSTSGNSSPTASSRSLDHGLADACLDGLGRGVHRGRRHELGGLHDQQVEDLVEQLEGGQLAGLGAGLARAARRVDRRGHPARGHDVGGQGPGREADRGRRAGDVGLVQPEAPACRSRDGQGSHRMSVAPPPTRATGPARTAWRQAVTASRDASTRSMARRRSSRPAGSNS